MCAFDPRKPSIARVYDYLIGGKDHFEADRELADRLLAISPSLGPTFRENRQFLDRAVTWAAAQGVGQFIDLGCGLPTKPSTQDSAQAVLPDARVVYVDNDPVVASHFAGLVHNDATISFLEMDMDDAGGVLAAASGHIDLARPACLVLGAMLHFYELTAGRDLVARYVSALAPGSYVVLTVGHAVPGEATDKMAAIYSASARPVRSHSAEDFATFFGGMELVPPGIADARSWRPGWQAVPPAAPRATWSIVGMARVRP